MSKTVKVVEQDGVFSACTNGVVRMRADNLVLLARWVFSQDLGVISYKGRTIRNVRDAMFQG